MPLVEVSGLAFAQPRSGSAGRNARPVANRLAAPAREGRVTARGHAELSQIRKVVDTVLRQGASPLRKALLQDLVAEVQLESPGAIVPVFRLPTSRCSTAVPMVGREGYNKPGQLMPCAPPGTPSRRSCVR